MPWADLPPRIKYAAGLFLSIGSLMALGAVVSALVADAKGPGTGIVSVRGYDEGTGSDGYHFRFSISATGPGAEWPIQRGFVGIVGIGFIIYGYRLAKAWAVSVLPAAFVAVLVGLLISYASAKLAMAGNATWGLPGMGIGFVLVIGGLVLAAGRREYTTARVVPAKAKANPKLQFAGFLLFTLGLVAMVLAGIRIFHSVATVRGNANLALRAELKTETSLEALGKLMKASAETSDTFRPGTGFFLHPPVIAIGWGLLHVWLAIGYFRGEWTRSLSLIIMALAAVVLLFGALAVAFSVPWWATTPDALAPGAVVTLLAGALAYFGVRKESV